MSQINNTTILKKSKTNLNERLSLFSILVSIMTIIIMLLIIFDPVTYSKSIINGLSLYFTRVLPGLLPFMFLVKVLTNQNVVNKLTRPFKKISQKLFGVSEYGLYAFIMSIISGYPIGSKITSDLFIQGKISEEELTKTAIFSSTAGTIFVIGSVGGLMLNSVKLGVYIYLINIVSVIIVSLLIHFFSKGKKNQKQTKSLSQNQALLLNKKLNLSTLTTDTTISLLSVGFYIALFSLIIDLVNNLNIFNFLINILGLNQENSLLFKGYMSGIIEMTNGAKTLSINHSPLSLALISSCISFSGFSIIMQSLSFLSTTKLKPHKFILGKALQSIVCFGLSLLFFSI